MNKYPYVIMNKYSYIIMNKYSYVIMNKYSFVNIINLEATRKLFLQLFSKIEEIFFYLPVFTKYFNVNYRKEKATGINQSLNNNSLI